MLEFLHTSYPKTYPVRLYSLLSGISANPTLHDKVSETHRVREHLRETLEAYQGDHSNLAELTKQYASHVSSLMAIYQKYRTTPSLSWRWKAVLSEHRGWVTTSTEFTSSSIYYEFISVLQLLGFSLLNQAWQLVNLDAKTELSTSIKQALKLFCQAAGVFQYIISGPLTWWHSAEELGAETSIPANRCLVG